MNRFLTLFVLVFLIAAGGCKGRKGADTGLTGRQGADTGKAVITFTEYEHNFGQVREGEKVGYIFLFRNTGTGNLVLNSAVTSCGCTVPKYDRKPIAPGSDGKIEVVFDTSGRNGIQTKTITVTSNASTPVVLLMIQADVINNN